MAVRAWKHDGTHFEKCDGGRPGKCPHLPRCTSLTEGFGRYLPDEGQPHYQVTGTADPFPLTLHGLSQAVGRAAAGSLSADEPWQVVKHDGPARVVVREFRYGVEVKQ